MAFAAEAIDGYLLNADPPKREALAALLASRSNDPKAQPFYRALEAVGARAADEAFIALRIVLAGLPTDDERVRLVRSLVNTVRAGGPGAAEARAAYAAALTRSPAAGNT
jgi:hypothetical protein